MKAMPGPSSPPTPPRAGGPDESPTVAKRDSSVRKARRPIDLVPKLAIDVLHDRGSEPHSFIHQGEVFRIGTHSSNHLVLHDPAVSRFHCKVTRDGSTWRVQDNGSLNGTTLDGVRIRDAELGAEGVLVLGDSRLCVRSVEGTDEVSLPNAQSFGAII